MTARNGNLSTLRRSRGSFVLKKRSRIRLQLVLCDDWHGNTGCLVAQDLALLTKVRTLIHEEISLLIVLYFPIFRVPEYSEYLLRTGFVLGFHWEELGILKRGEEGPLRIGGLAQRTGRR